MSLTIGQSCRGSTSTKREQEGLGWGLVVGGRTWTGRREGALTERGEDKRGSFSFPPLPLPLLLQAVVEKDSEEEGGTGSEGHVSLITQHGRGKHCH